MSPRIFGIFYRGNVAACVVLLLWLTPIMLYTWWERAKEKREERERPRREARQRVTSLLGTRSEPTMQGRADGFMSWVAEQLDDANHTLISRQQHLSRTRGTDGEEFARQRLADADRGARNSWASYCMWSEEMVLAGLEVRPSYKHYLKTT